MEFSLASLTLAVGITGSADAHYRFSSLIAGGQTTTAYQYVRQNSNYNSPASVGSNDLRCNTGANTGGSTQTYPVTASTQVRFKMDQAIYHVGPSPVHISKAPSTAPNYDGSGGWAKIYQIAPTTTSSEITWNTENKDTFAFTLPSSLAAGEHLLGIEHIALHSMPAQFYSSYAQFEVPGKISFPSGININICYPVLTSYSMPGPAVWSG
ncbi:hypothetical protein L873DRAFT_1837172 [Choiromyces venosus 120613-1]|uniref:AA9 family lytic polysaccharide monooxygenase n=1 Tax=Choiromyces venosus 120613-1 TaxID=1336337 RepID=A0A3N4JEZ5_9PEZI|nr:hypothetical protein L873DRAFT_1837172 [Choiromyces venosus 120613-1]